MDDITESVDIGEGIVGELMLFEVAPASFDIVQLGGVFRQPFEGEPGALGEYLCGQLVWSACCGSAPRRLWQFRSAERVSCGCAASGPPHKPANSDPIAGLRNAVTAHGLI
jgi:hypothetical protein